MRAERRRPQHRAHLRSPARRTPRPVEGDTLQLDIFAEEAKSKQFGFSAGYGTFEGLIGGIEFREHNLFGTGRPLTTSIEVSQRSYKGEIVYEDPFFFDTEIDFKNRIGALTYDFDGYSKFEIGDRIEFTEKIAKQYQVGINFSVRHVEVTSADIKPQFLGPKSYLIDTLGFTQTYDRRESPLVAPRGFVADNTVEIATTLTATIALERRYDEKCPSVHACEKFEKCKSDGRWKPAVSPGALSAVERIPSAG